MDHHEHLVRIRELRKRIDSGDPEQLKVAEKELEAMERIRPWLIEYMCARAALMLTKGDDVEVCRSLLDFIDNELYPHKELVDIFSLKQRTFSVGSNQWRQCAYSAALYGEQSDVLGRYEQKLDDHRSRFLLDPSNEEILILLRDDYFVCRDMLMYYLLMLLWCFRRGTLGNVEAYLEKDAGQDNVEVSDCEINWKYLKKMLCDKRSHTFVLVDDVDTVTANIDVLAMVLKLMGQKVIILRSSVPAEVVSEESSLELCVKAADMDGEYIVIPIMQFENKRDNSAALIEFLATNATEDGKIIFFAEDRVMDRLHAEKKFAKRLQRMSPCLPPILENRMSFGWAGDYRAYIGYVYGFSVEERMNRSAECEFSIVIPARNSTGALQHAIRTCLDLDYPDFEIVLSDNSDAGNDCVYQLWKELEDSRIQYVHTPCVLPIAASFEFAFLQARGEFIFSIGADDGVFPWALHALHHMLPQMGVNDVLVWVRGSYAWPDFQPMQANQLIVPLWEKREPPRARPADMAVAAREWLKQSNPSLFDKPMLYINSGFRRRYFKRVYEATGRLWDGFTQDLHMGVVSCFVCRAVSMTSYPITLAGMSGHSYSKRGVELINDKYSLMQLHEKFQHAGVLDYAYRRVEYNCLYFMNTFLPAMYWSLWRLYDTGCIAHEDMNELDRGALFTHLVNMIDRNGILFENQCRKLRYMASLKGNEAYRKSVEEACVKLAELSCRDEAEERNDQFPSYFTGISGRYLHLDASEFGIKNIHDAVIFCEKLLKLSDCYNEL